MNNVLFARPYKFYFIIKHVPNNFNILEYTLCTIILF